MRIGVDATCWGNKRGFGRFTRELLEALLEIDRANEYLFFIDDKTAEIDSIPARVEKIVVNADVSAIKAASADGRRSVKDLWAMSRAVLRRKVDVFFFPASYSYFPVFNRAKIVVTLHDVIAEHHPELIFPDAKSKFFWNLKQNAAVRQADLILTVSEYSKRQIADYFKLPDARLRVVNEAARPVFKASSSGAEDAAPRPCDALARLRLAPDEKFLLYVGGISPHKNLGALISAFDLIVADPALARTKLLLVGDYKDDPFFSAYPELKKQAAELKLENKVVFTGFVPDRDLACLYKRAELLVMPALEEGFGLPAIEAMAGGCAVAASNCGSLPEVLGEAGRFFDPLDFRQMAETIERILSDDSSRNRMKDAGLKRARQFTWEKAAEDTLKIFRELNPR